MSSLASKLWQGSGGSPCAPSGVQGWSPHQEIFQHNLDSISSSNAVGTNRKLLANRSVLDVFWQGAIEESTCLTFPPFWVPMFSGGTAFFGSTDERSGGERCCVVMCGVVMRGVA